MNLQEILEKEKIKIEQNTHGILKYGRVDFSDSGNEFTSVNNYGSYPVEEDYDASYIDYTVVKDETVLMECVSAGTVDNFLRHLISKYPNDVIARDPDSETTKRIVEIVKRLKDARLMPWNIETKLQCDDLVTDEYISYDELKLLSGYWNLHEVVKNTYMGFTDLCIYIPEEVLDAYKAARKDYIAADICVLTLEGILDEWYAHIIFNWFKKSIDPKEAAYALYMQDI